MVDNIYANYGQWKDWAPDGFMQPTPTERNYFADELRGAALAGKDVLEIGFGNGGFLRWARDAGATLFGTEVLQSAIDRAQAEGVTILPLDLSQSLPAHAGRFSVIAAFDVMEHLSY